MTNKVRAAVMIKPGSIKVNPFNDERLLCVL